MDNKLTLTPDKLSISEHRGLMHLLISLLNDLGEEYLISKPETLHNQAIADACSLIIDELLEVSCG